MTPLLERTRVCAAAAELAARHHAFYCQFCMDKGWLHMNGMKGKKKDAWIYAMKRLLLDPTTPMGRAFLEEWYEDTDDPVVKRDIQVVLSRVRPCPLP